MKSIILNALALATSTFLITIIACGFEYFFNRKILYLKIGCFKYLLIIIIFDLIISDNQHCLNQSVPFGVGQNVKTKHIILPV